MERRTIAHLAASRKGFDRTGWWGENSTHRVQFPRLSWTGPANGRLLDRARDYVLNSCG